MLKRLPRAVGQALWRIKPGLDKTLYADPIMSSVPESIGLRSAAFANLGRIPVRYTQDGEKLSPPLAWIGIPPEAISVVLLVEDADSPTRCPLTHAIVLDLPPTHGNLAAGALKSPHHEGQAHDLGRNSLFRARYLPPDPPPGHGEHRYVFQAYAVDKALVELNKPSRDQLRAALRGHTLARGRLIGVYGRK